MSDPRPPRTSDLPAEHGVGRWGRLRLRPWPVAFSLVSALLFVISFQLGWPEMWQGLLLAVPLMIATTGLGWRAGAILVPVGAFLVWLNAQLGTVSEPLWAIGGLAAILVLASAAGHNLFSLWHASEARARRSERRERLLREAALELHHADSEATLYAAVPRLLAEILSFTHAEVVVPDGDEMVVQVAHGWHVAAGFRVPMTSVTGRAARTASELYIEDVRADSDYVPAPYAAAARSELALPIRAEGTVKAVLNLEHARPRAFSNGDRRTLRALVQIVEEVLVRVASLEAARRQTEEQEFVARLTQRLLHAEGAREAAAATLHEVLPALRLDVGAILVLRSGRLRPLAIAGAVPDPLRRVLADGVPLEGILLRVWEERSTVLVDDDRESDTRAALAQRWGVGALAVVPIVNAIAELQALLLVARLGERRTWEPNQLRSLEIVTGSLGVVLDRANLNRRLVAMLEVMRGLARADEPAGLYRRAVESAVRLIPGVEAASILLRKADGFHFEAAVGFELEPLRAFGAISEDEGLNWYGRAHPDDYRRGVPRLLKGDEVAPRSAAATSQRGFHAQRAARVDDIRANICVPITDHGEVAGILNLDSFTRVDAFGGTSLRLAEAFAQQIAVILRQSEYVATLQRSAVTDPLTALGNREGFHRRLHDELMRARRYDHPLSVVLLDLDNFKRINDDFGHQAGDDALLAVANVLRREQRASDCAFRWGGDEFVMLLPELGPADARRAAERFAGLISHIEVNGAPLGASVGIASYPEDGTEREQLLRRADDLMYHRKQQPRPPQPAV